MNIIAAKAAQSTCPPWCAADIPSHISAERVVIATAGPERAEVYVSLELDAQPGSTPAVRVLGAGDTPMSPQQALELGQALIAAGFAAATTWPVTR